jgi:hypothetical protein
MRVLRIHAAAAEEAAEAAASNDCFSGAFPIQ